MLLRHVILLLLTCFCANGRAESKPQDELPLFDQIATASENVPKSSTKSRNPRANELEENAAKREHSSDLSSTTEATSSYDDQIILVFPSSKAARRPEEPRENASANARKNEEILKNLEEDLMHSPAARIFLDLPHRDASNRRSFDFQDDGKTFELLKVHNDTPAIANYNDFYENLGDSSEGQEGKERRSEKDGNSRERYYAYGTAKEEKESNYRAEKVRNNHHPRGSAKHDGHGQNTARSRNSPTPQTPARTKYEDAKEKNANGANEGDSEVSASSVDSISDRYKFTKPVVVVEPSSYNVDLKFDTPKYSVSSLKRDDSSGAATSAWSNDRYANDAYQSEKQATGRSYDGTDDSSDFSDDGSDYVDYAERPRRVQKSRRRPYSSVNSRRLPKEHRTIIDESFESDERGRKRANAVGRSKINRQRAHGSSWLDEERGYEREESNEDERTRDYSATHFAGYNVGSENARYRKGGNGKAKVATNTWSQLSPNVEISQSNGIEINPTEKPNLVIPVNLMPVSNFDHATALGNSQGFDASNAVYQNVVTPSSIGSLVSTMSPVVNTPHTVLAPNVIAANVQRALPTLQSIAISTPVPDIIVGQNTFQNPTHAVLLPQNDPRQKIAQQYPNNQYQASTTVAPIFAVTTDAPLQAVRIQNRPVNQMNHVLPTISHYFLPQPTVQTLSTVVPAATQQTNAGYSIQVNPHGLHGQNTVVQENLQIQNYPSVATTTATSVPQTVGRLNIVTVENQQKKNAYVGETGGNFLTSASFTVGQNGQVHSSDNSYYASNQLPQNFVHSPLQMNSYRIFKDNTLAKPKTYLQTTHFVPAVFQPTATVSTVSLNGQFPTEQQQQQNVQGMNVHIAKIQEQNQQYQSGLQPMHVPFHQNQFIRNNNRVPNVPYQTIDNVGSQSVVSNVNNFNSLNSPYNPNAAHLPKVGTKNVEILNPNIKASPVDVTGTNSLENGGHPATFLTTPIPIFSTTAFVTARPPSVATANPQRVNFQSFADSYAEIEQKANQERPLFNPINFMPNADVLKSQNALNSKLQSNEPLQSSLNLVPLLPDGNFFKPTLAAQNELMAKPKLTSDLEKYAEEMFKESLKTIYSSHKWNNDKKVAANESNDIVTLQNELMRLKASIPEASNKNKEILDGHQSETNIRTAEVSKASTQDQKKGDPLLHTLEQLLKAHPSEPIRLLHGARQKGVHSPEQSEGNLRNAERLKDFLTPPKPNFASKGPPFHEKLTTKKRPQNSGPPPRFGNSGHHAHFDRAHGRSHLKANSKPLKSAATLSDEASASSNLDSVYVDVNKGSRLSFHERRPAFAAAPSAGEVNVAKLLRELRSKNDENATNKYDINHPKIHNLLGLLMKSKQLPPGNRQQSYFRNNEQLHEYFEEEKRKMQQLYDDSLRDYFQKKSDGGATRFVART